MDTQLRYVTKEELHKIIDEMPGDKLMVMTYEKDTGISDKGRMIKKKKTKVVIILVIKEAKSWRQTPAISQMKKPMPIHIFCT